MMHGVFPGSFDPPTNGHLDIIQRASKLCDRLTVAIGENIQKQKNLFVTKEKIEILAILTKSLENVDVVSFSGLIVEFAKKIEANYIIRGLRAYSDFEYEFPMALANRKLSGIETLFLMADESHTHINASFIREIAHFHGPLASFVPKLVEERIRKFSMRNSTT